MFRKIKHTLHRKKTLDEFNQRIQLVVKPSLRFEAGTWHGEFLDKSWGELERAFSR